VLLAITVSVCSQSKARVLTAGQAESLVRAVALSETKTRDISIQRGPDTYAPGLPYFSEYGPLNPYGSSLIGHFLVDPRTGDVFDAIVCQEYQFASLAKLQKSIRKQIGLSVAEYRGLKLSKPPLCD